MEADVAVRAPPVSLQPWTLWSALADVHLPASASLCPRAWSSWKCWRISALPPGALHKRLKAFVGINTPAPLPLLAILWHKHSSLARWFCIRIKLQSSPYPIAFLLANTLFTGYFFSPVSLPHSYYCIPESPPK